MSIFVVTRGVIKQQSSTLIQFSIDKFTQILVPAVPLMHTGRARAVVVDDIALGVARMPEGVERALGGGGNPGGGLQGEKKKK